MFSEDILARLSQLNQQRLPIGTSAVEKCAGGRPGDRRGATLPTTDTADEDVSQLPPGVEVTNAWGTHWLRQRSLAEIWPHGELWLTERLVRLDQSPSPGSPRSRELRALDNALPEHVVYLDLETCGFSGSMVFLIGLIYPHDRQFVLSQLLARNYAEEKAMLQTLWSIVAEQARVGHVQRQKL